MGLEIICTRPNLVLVLTSTNLTDITIAKRLASGVYAPLVSVKIIWRAEALDSARAIADIALKWLLVALIVLPILASISLAAPGKQ